MSQETKKLGSTDVAIRFSSGTTLQGLGGDGLVHSRRPPPGRLRSARLPAQLDTSPQFEAALSELGIVEQETIELEAVALRPGADDSVVLSPARARTDTAPRVVMYQDESGGVSWHFEALAAPTSRPRPGLRAAGGSPRFVIPLRSSATRTALRGGVPRRSLRGPFTKIGRKIFKVFVLPALSAMLEDPVRWMGEIVEQRCRRNLVWGVTADNYRQPPQTAFDDWPSLRAGPVLLLVHGIFSSVEGMLGGLPRDAMEAWQQRYANRVIGFNHLTVSASPEDNARCFLDTVAQALPGQRLTFDIVCHSRGGIVSRTLAERGEQLRAGHGCEFRSVYFAGTPNAGSPLGDADHMIDMIDLFTNCLTNLPDGPTAYSLEVILGLVTLVGHAGARALPGIAALGTQGSYITNILNRASATVPTLYGATAANYEPAPGRENGWLLDRIGNPAMDRIFTVDGHRMANDLVVPQRGVFGANGHPAFPIADPLVFEADDGVWHTAFFSQPRVLEHIDAHWRRVDLATATAAIGATTAPAAPLSPTAAGAPGGILRGRLRGARAGVTRAISVPPIPAAARAEPTVTRDPALDFHERLEAGASDDLHVHLKLPGAGPAPAGRLTLEFDAGSNEIELVAELSAPGFRVEGRRQAPLVIKRQRDPKSEQAVFRLTALDPGPKPVDRRIEVSFWRGNECVGGITHSTVVVPKGWQEATPYTPDRVSALQVSSRRRDTADLVWSVRRQEPGKDVFELSARCQIAGQEYDSRPFGVLELGGQQLGDYLTAALDPSFHDFPGGELTDAEFSAAMQVWNERFLTTLSDLGKQLWVHLPESFRNEYLRLGGLEEPPRSICIFSDELSFPWEIVRPSGPVRGEEMELPPLGVSHVLGRWRPGTKVQPQPQARPVQHMAIVMPDAQQSGLASALEEIQALKSLIPVAEPITPVRRKQLDQLLASTDIQVVHFSGHGATGAHADLTALELEDGDSISAMAFAGNMLGRRAQPLLYLNACTVGRGGAVMGRAGGFAGNCIESGWSGVVAPYWPVYDPSASAFSVSFYRKLKSGRSIGEALQELRAENADDPTAMSYAYFGDPFARLLID